MNNFINYNKKKEISKSFLVLLVNVTVLKLNVKTFYTIFFRSLLHYKI